jgi:ankyrin repeat protein
MGYSKYNVMTLLKHFYKGYFMQYRVMSIYKSLIFCLLSASYNVFSVEVEEARAFTNEELHKGARRNNLSLIKEALEGLPLSEDNPMLIQADVNALDQYRNTPLDIAVNYGHIETIKVLLVAGASVATRRIESLVHHAAQHVNLGQNFAPGDVAGQRTFDRAKEMMRLLLYHNAPVDISDYYQTGAIKLAMATPLMAAAVLNDYNGALKLLDTVYNPTQPGPSAATRFFMRLGLAQPEQRPSIDDRDALGMTALHWAAARGNTRLVELLLERGANPNLRDNEDRTPVELARRNGYANTTNDMNDVAWLILVHQQRIIQDRINARANEHSAILAASAALASH